MKLPEYCTDEEYTKYHTGEKSAIQLHNEQIAAQLTIAYHSQPGSPYPHRNSPEEVSGYYKNVLNKLNKGEL